MRSDQLDQLFAALSTAQGAFADITKDKTADAGKYKYAYADLADVVQGTKAALTANGLAVTQLVHGQASGSIKVTTILGHKSGQFIGDEWEIPASGLDMQRLGGLITYARRYSYTAILGIAADTDDDGKQASASQRVNGALSPSGKRIPQGEWPKGDDNLKITLPNDAVVEKTLKPVSPRNRALASNLVDLRDAINDEIKAAKEQPMDDKQKAAFVERVRKLERDTNAQLVLRDMTVTPKADKVSDVFKATFKAIAQLVEHDQIAPVADEEVTA